MGKSNLKIRAAIIFTIFILFAQQSVFAIGASATASPSTIQQGQTSQLNCSGSGGSGTYYYSWSSVAPGFYSTMSNPIVAPNVTTTYTCQVFNGGSYTYASVTVFVTAGTGLTATATATPGSITAGQNTQLDCNPVGGSGNYTYSWTSSPAGFTSTQKTPTASPTVNTTYTCTVTSGTATATATASVTVTPLLTATTSATPSAITAGQSSQLDCSATGGNGTYTYAWTSNPAGFTSTQKNPTVSPTVNTTYTCAVTSGQQTLNSSVSVAVSSNPNLTASATAAPGNVNPGQSSALNCNPAGGNGSFSYSWISVPAGFTSTQKSPVVTPAVTTTYMCTVTSGTQTTTASTAVTVTTLPALSANATATPSDITAGQSSTLNCTPTGGSGTYSYSWTSNPAGFTSTQKSPVVTPSATTIYTCTVTSGTQTTTATATVRVATIPSLIVTTGATPASITAGQSSQLSCTSTGGTGTYTYTWTSVPAGFTSAQQNPVVNPSVTTTYTCSVTSGTQTSASSVTVTVGTVNPPLTVTASASPITIRSGQSSQLSCAPAGGSGNYTFLWTSAPAGFNSTAQNPVVAPRKSTTYTVVVNDGTTTATAFVRVRVTGGWFTASVTASDATICEGGNVNAEATADGGSGTYTYSWSSLPAGLTSSEQSVSFTPEKSTRVICSISDGDTTITEYADIVVNNAPVISAGNDTTVPNNVKVKLNGSGKNFSTVEWSSDGDGTFTDPNNLKSTYVPGPSDLTRGSATLRLTANAAAPCSGSVNSSVTLTFTTATSVPDPRTNDYNVTVYPNPTNGPVYVRFEGNEDSDASASVVDLSGKVLQTRTVKISKGGEISFDLSPYAKGIYFITIESGQFKKTHKVILN